MNVLVTCDSYKDCLTSLEVCHAISLGLSQLIPAESIISIPIADGGEGSLEIVKSSKRVETITCQTLDPLLRPINTEYLWDEKTKTAYIEMAKASGIELLTVEERNCYITSSYGTGILIGNAIEKGVKTIYLFIGGSATCDLGIGMAAACGYSFYDEGDNEIEMPKGKDLNRIANYIDNRKNWEEVEINTICDVDNVLYGPNGAAYIYGKQKGGTSETIPILDKGLKRINELIKDKTGIDYSRAKGGGAAGGMGVATLAFLNGRLIGGGNFFFDFVKMGEKIREADVIITGEGKMDYQTLNGKLIFRLGELTKFHDKQLIAVCGKIDVDSEDYPLLNVKTGYSLAHMTDNKPYSAESTKAMLVKVGKRIAETELRNHG